MATMPATIDTAKRVAYVFQEPDGWHVCDDAADILDARGRAYTSKRDAVASLRMARQHRQTEYTHFRCGASKPKRLD